MLEQNADALAGQPAEALIGKCVKVFITSAQKWHISGHIIDASPEPEHAPVDYFERLEAQRKAELLRQFQDDEDALAKAKTQAIAIKNPSSSSKTAVQPQFFIGLLLHALGVYIVMRSLFL